jgi:hypothetical protein
MIEFSQSHRIVSSTTADLQSRAASSLALPSVGFDHQYQQGREIWTGQNRSVPLLDEGVHLPRPGPPLGERHLHARHPAPPQPSATSQCRRTQSRADGPAWARVERGRGEQESRACWESAFVVSPRHIPSFAPAAGSGRDSQPSAKHAHHPRYRSAGGMQAADFLVKRTLFCLAVVVGCEAVGRHARHP